MAAENCSPPVEPIEERGMARDVTRSFKERLGRGDRVFGLLLGLGNDPDSTVEAIKESGYDYFMLDNEHTLMGKETIFNYIRLARQAELPIILRPESQDANWHPYLDAGINGLMLPDVNSVEEAARAISKAYFPPLGKRGSGIGMSPYLLDGMDAEGTPLLEMTKYVNDNTMLFPQTESVAAVECLGETLKLDGVTGTIVGPNDLVLDIGGIRPGALRSELRSSPAMEERLLQIARMCRERGKVGGIGGYPPRALLRWAQEGYQLFMLGYIAAGNLQKLQQSIKQVREVFG